MTQPPCMRPAAVDAPPVSNPGIAYLALVSHEFNDNVAHGALGDPRCFLRAERSQHDGRPVEVAPVDLRELADGVARSFAPELTRQAVWVVVDVPGGASVVSNRELIARILQNLVGNAVKHCTAGVVRIDARRGWPGGRWVVSVADEGPGIAPDQLAHVVEAFRRGAGPRAGPGVGVGLTSVAEAARLLDVEITAESRVGGGSTFRLRFPPHMQPL